MATIKEIIHQLLPSGPNGDHKFETAPSWPPDLFAIAATLAERAGIYAEAPYTAGWDSKTFIFDEAYLADVLSTAKLWAAGSNPPDQVQRMWEKLLQFGADDLQTEKENSHEWKLALLKLLAYADEAFQGTGFLPSPGKPTSEFVTLFLRNHVEKLQAEATGGTAPDLSMPYIPMSLCRYIAPTDACVQPKTMTPNVGCNLRSLSHHLALLPARGTVVTSWYCAHPVDQKEDQADHPFNVLVVPFPYVIRGTSFSCVDNCTDPKNRYFSLRQSWLGECEPSFFTDFLADLIKESEKEVERVHAIVIPEAALTESFAREVAQRIAASNKSLELFVAGALAIDSTSGQPPRNLAYTSRFHTGELLKDWTQSKHHRWRLDERQIRNYHLGHALDPTAIWWEQIDIANRACTFTVVRPGASLAVLVCEDLARFDPVLPVINAVGPNLVIALLMDGPQLEKRWPGRYATALADDPGSSVLTLTSLGMIRRSARPGDAGFGPIALWKEPGGSAHELTLGNQDDALVLSLTLSTHEQFTLDGRTDGRQARRFSLSGVCGTRAQNRPAWLRS